jgi:hypothetical protein
MRTYEKLELKLRYFAAFEDDGKGPAYTALLIMEKNKRLNQVQRLYAVLAALRIRLNEEFVELSSPVVSSDKYEETMDVFKLVSDHFIAIRGN